MTTETTAEGAQGGAVEQVQQAAGEPAAVTFTAEQQGHIDRLIGERLKRDRAKWQADQDAKAKAAADEAEAKRQAEQGEWEALARKHEGRATELDGALAAARERLERADGVIAELVEARKAGLPEAMLKALAGRDLYDQLALAEAFHASLPAGGTAGARQATPPTPPAQGRNGLTVDEKRQKAARTI